MFGIRWACLRSCPFQSATLASSKKFKTRSPESRSLIGTVLKRVNNKMGCNQYHTVEKWGTNSWTICENNSQCGKYDPFFIRSNNAKMAVFETLKWLKNDFTQNLSGWKIRRWPCEKSNLTIFWVKIHFSAQMKDLLSLGKQFVITASLHWFHVIFMKINFRNFLPTFSPKIQSYTIFSSKSICKFSEKGSARKVRLNFKSWFDFFRFKEMGKKS